MGTARQTEERRGARDTTGSSAQSSPRRVWCRTFADAPRRRSSCDRPRTLRGRQRHTRRRRHGSQSRLASSAAAARTAPATRARRPRLKLASALSVDATVELACAAADAAIDDSSDDCHGSTDWRRGRPRPSPTMPVTIGTTATRSTAARLAPASVITLAESWVQPNGPFCSQHADQPHAYRNEKASRCGAFVRWAVLGSNQ